MFRTIILVLIAMGLPACSDEQNKVEEHVWKKQTDIIDKAKDVEKMLNDAAVQQQKLIEEQTQH